MEPDKGVLTNTDLRARRPRSRKRKPNHEQDGGHKRARLQGPTQSSSVTDSLPELLQVGRQSGEIRVTKDSYALDGVMRGRFGKTPGPEIGVISESGCLSWAWTARSLGWRVAWIMTRPTALGVINKTAFAKEFDFVDWGELADLPSVTGLLAENLVNNPPDAVNFVYYPSKRGRRVLPGWQSELIKWDHSSLGGVTSWSRHMICSHRGTDSGGTFALPAQPRRRLSSILGSAVGGRPVDPPGLALWPPRVTPLPADSRLNFHGDGLLSRIDSDLKVITEDVRSPSGWVRRGLTIPEQLLAWDMPTDMQSHMSGAHQTTFLAARNRWHPPMGVMRSVLLGHGFWISGGVSLVQPQAVKVPKEDDFPLEYLAGMLSKYLVAADALADAIAAGALTDSVPESSKPSHKNSETLARESGLKQVDPVGEEKMEVVVEGDLTIANGCNPAFKFGQQAKPLPRVEEEGMSIDEEARLWKNHTSVEDSTDDEATQVKEADRNAAAAKSDDADIPLALWNDRIPVAERIYAGPARKPNQGSTAGEVFEPVTDAMKIRALDLLRKRGARWWKRETTRDLCAYLKMSGDAPAETDAPFVTCTCIKTTHDRGITWSEGGRDAYCSWWRLRPRSGDKDVTVARDILRRIGLATWWDWAGGSTLFFWRWPEEFRRCARDGTPMWIRRDQLPNYRRPQRDVSDVLVKKRIMQKLLTVLDRDYMEPGLVLALTSFFAVPKGKDDIRMVYDGTVSGLNAALWAPWFPLPTIESHLRVVNPGTFMGDVDLGEMFLNFPLDEEVRKYAGVDLTKYFPELSEPGQTLWLRWARCAMGLRTSPFSTVQALSWLEEIIFGDRRDPNNVFRWDKIETNLPGSADYDPSRPWVSKIRNSDGHIAADIMSYIDDLRSTGPSEEECWRASRRVASLCNHYGIQDAPRKRRAPSQTPGPWAGSILHTDQAEVNVLISDDKWKKTRNIIEKWCGAVDEYNFQLTDGREPVGLDVKELLSDRGFLIYVARTYPSMVPYLKGLHLTIDGWRGGRDSDGWRQTDAQIRAHRDEAGDECFPETAPQWVHPVPRLIDDLYCLLALTESPSAPRRRIRSNHIVRVEYGLADASGKGFGSLLSFDGEVVWRSGQWHQDYSDQSSNWREFGNVVIALEEFHARQRVENLQIFMFTDNIVTECAFYKGSSHSRSLFALVLRLRKLEIKAGWDLHVLHIAGTRMIASGVDGLSRGDGMTGIMGGDAVLDHVPLHLTALERADTKGNELRTWITSWWGCDAKVLWLNPTNWFDLPYRDGYYVWSPPPAIADVALERLCKVRLKRPGLGAHLFIVPRLMTSRWRKQLTKAATFVFQIPVGSAVWGSAQHEPLILAVCLPLSKHSPWNLRNTSLVGDLEGSLCEVFEHDGKRTGYLLRQFLRLATRLESMSSGLVRKMLHPRNER